MTLEKWKEEGSDFSAFCNAEKTLQERTSTAVVRLSNITVLSPTAKSYKEQTVFRVLNADALIRMNEYNKPYEFTTVPTSELLQMGASGTTLLHFNDAVWYISPRAMTSLLQTCGMMCEAAGRQSLERDLLLTRALSLAGSAMFVYRQENGIRKIFAVYSEKHLFRPLQLSEVLGPPGRWQPIRYRMTNAAAELRAVIPGTEVGDWVQGFTALHSDTGEAAWLTIYKCWFFKTGSYSIVDEFTTTAKSADPAAEAAQYLSGSWGDFGQELLRLQQLTLEKQAVPGLLSRILIPKLSAKRLQPFAEQLMEKSPDRINALTLLEECVQIPEREADLSNQGLTDIRRLIGEMPGEI